MVTADDSVVAPVCVGCRFSPAQLWSPGAQMSQRRKSRPEQARGQPDRGGRTRRGEGGFRQRSVMIWLLKLRLNTEGNEVGGRVLIQ